jgi:HAD superfamily hydrolase (TIGR01490 family)
VSDAQDELDAELLAAVAARRTGAPRAAFFDLDGTILTGASSLVMAREFHRAGLLGTRAALRSTWADVRYRLLGADHARLERIRDAASAASTGWPVEDVRRIAEQALERTLVPLVRDAARRRIEAHRAAGDDVWIVTTSGAEVVAPLARHLGITDVIASRGGIDAAGRYDGTVRFYAYGPAKSRAIRQVSAVRGYDLADCTAYSDSVTDLPMLEAVGHPVAIDPDRALRRRAQALGWPIERFSVDEAASDRRSC